MIGSGSIGRLSRATGDEQLLKSQRVGDKKHKQDNSRRNKEKRGDDADAQGAEFEAVIVDVKLSTNKQQATSTEDTSTEKTSGNNAVKTQPQVSGHSSADEDTESGSHSTGHIDVTG